MKISIIAVGRTSTAYIRQAIEGYLSRVNHYINVELKELPDVKRSASLTPQRQKEAEADALLREFQPTDRVVLLDERGREMTSVELSSAIERHMLSGLKRLVFVVGGPYGFAPRVYARADAKLSLSRMTFTHEMVRLFFVEQVYRAMTIMRGEPYHHI